MSSFEWHFEHGILGKVLILSGRAIVFLTFAFAGWKILEVIYIVSQRH